MTVRSVLVLGYRTWSTSAPRLYVKNRVKARDGLAPRSCRLRDGNAFESQGAHDGKQQTAIFIAEGGSHLVTALLDLLKGTLADIIGANRLPVLLGELKEGETGIAITA
jgi:hypothetical protein